MAILEAMETGAGQDPSVQPVAPAPVSSEQAITYTLVSEVLFGSGKASLTSGGKSALSKAAQSIRQQYPDAMIQVRGHTDNVPIKYSAFKSNWELSCVRAASVVRYLVESEGFLPSQLSAVGCGDTEPIASNDTADGRAKNRRAELVVFPQGVRVADIKGAR
jgi:chemotaxis protein MotB